MKKIWKMLAEKGKFATIIGLFFALPVNVKFIIDFFRGLDYSRESLLNLCIINAIAMVWFILPSKITIKSKVLIIEVED